MSVRVVAGAARWSAVVCSGLALLVALAGCAPRPADPHLTLPSRPSSSAVPRTSSGPPLLVGSGLVLDSGAGPELCLGAILLSQPPQCTGFPLRGWTWPKRGVTRVAGVTYGSFDVVGTWDGHRLTVDKVVTKEQAADSLPPRSEPDLTTPCPRPRDGWPVPDPSRSTSEDQQRVMDLAGRLPDYVELWVDEGGDPTGSPQTTVVDVQVTGDPADAERQLRTVWGGPLCVSHGAHTKAELSRVQRQLVKEPGLVSSSTLRGVLTVELAYDDGSRQRGYDERYGVGLVHVESALHPYLG